MPRYQVINNNDFINMLDTLIQSIPDDDIVFQEFFKTINIDYYVTYDRQFTIEILKEIYYYQFDNNFKSQIIKTVQNVTDENLKTSLIMIIQTNQTDIFIKKMINMYKNDIREKKFNINNDTLISLLKIKILKLLFENYQIQEFINYMNIVFTDIKRNEMNYIYRKLREINGRMEITN